MARRVSPARLTEALKQEAVRLGFDLVGACPAVGPPGYERFRRWLSAGYAGRMQYLADRAEAYEHPRHVLEGAQSILMLGASYRTVEPCEPQAGQARVSRYAWGGDYHELLRRRLRGLADLHRRLRPDAAVRGVVDTAPLLERDFARLAGLGWIGKNTLLVNRRLGSWVFLAALLTSERLEYDEPHEGDHCGSCRACLDACPTRALADAYQLDARRCISYLTIELRDAVPKDLRQPMGSWVFGCDACQDVCPWNRRAPKDCPDFRVNENGTVPLNAVAPVTEEDTFQPLPGMNPIALAELFSLDEAAFRRRFRHTPLWRARKRGLLSRTAIVLGNQATESALPGLCRGLHDAEPLVRAACAWALGRYDDVAAKEALKRRLSVETHQDVRAEIEAAIESVYSG